MSNLGFIPLRRQVFDRIHNVRDLGGYATPNGMTAWGRIFRSGRLFDPSKDDLKKLKELQIHTIIDLRTDGERADHPTVILPDVRHEHIDFLGFIGNLEENDLVEHPMGLAHMYEAILDQSTLARSAPKHGGYHR